MSLNFYVNDDGQLAPHPAAFSGRAIELQSPATAWRAPRSPARLAVPVLVICGLVALLALLH